MAPMTSASFAAVQAGEHRLQRREVERVGAAHAHRPGAEGGAEEVQVVAPQLGGPRHPQDAQRGGGQGEHDVAAALADLGQDEQRGEGLPAALAHHVDDGLRARADAVGQGHEQELRPRAVERVAQGAVRALEEERGHHPAAQRDARGAEEDQRGQHPEGAVQAEDAHDPAEHDRLHPEREQVQHHVEGGEEVAQLLLRDLPRDRALEDVVGEGERDGGHQHQAAEHLHVRVVSDHPHRLQQVRAALRGAGHRGRGAAGSASRGRCRSRRGRPTRRARGSGRPAGRRGCAPARRPPPRPAGCRRPRSCTAAWPG